MKKIKLDSVFEHDYTAIGLVCSENDYRLSWLINHHLNLNLSRIDDHIIESRSGEELLFPVYYYVENDEINRYVLVNNKTANGCLLPEHRTMDYLIFVYAKDSVLDAQNLLTKLKHIPSVLLAVILDKQLIKSVENIQFDII